MSKQFDLKQNDQESKKESENQNNMKRYVHASFCEGKSQHYLLDEPRELPAKSYSLGPDIATGWKPKKLLKVNLQNVFPINFNNNVIDEIVRNLSKKNTKNFIVYLGSRKLNSYYLHENRQYENPYPIDKKIESMLPQRPGLSKYAKLQKSKLQFNSDFESGNLDVAIKVSDLQYDLFMRVDSNTKGHTNWYFFEVKNQNFVGTIKFNICNFRRDRSLYQRGMKPYVRSEKQGGEWIQKGQSIQYRKQSLRYTFLEDDQQLTQSLRMYYTLTFSYTFDNPHDKTYFAYCVPYTYAYMLNFIKTLSGNPFYKYQTGWRTLSGLPVPLLQITDFEQPQFNKKVVLVAARIHPGESNSSYVCHGIIKTLCSDQSKIQEFLKKFHFYIVPMINPDGVVAGNYRTSLFGKDLNRTFHQSRKYAFPETFNLFQLAMRLKRQHKQRFSIYLDLHGHSVKKNVFFYGPDYNITHTFYSKSRQLAKILGNLTSMFRYYSCIFRISGEKSTTARATFNRNINIPFTYTVESSNGAFYDSISHIEKPFASKNWIQMGNFIVKGLSFWAQSESANMGRYNRVGYFQQNQTEIDQQQKQLKQKDPPGKEHNSDDEMEQGKSDSQPEDEDLTEQQLQKIQNQIQGKIQNSQIQFSPKDKRPVISPNKSERMKGTTKSNFNWSLQLRKSEQSTLPKYYSKKQKLPPLNLQVNPVHFLAQSSNKKKVSIAEALKNLTMKNLHPPSEGRKRMSISEMVINSHESLSFEEQNLVIEKISKKPTMQQIFQRMKKL